MRSVPDIIYRLDGQGHIVYISEAVRRYGYEPVELVGQSIFELVHPEDRDVPVVLFTGYFAESGQFEGVDGVLLKPFSSDQLMQQVRQVLDR